VLCNDGDACTTDFCSNGSCQYIEPVAAEFDCNDGDDEDCDGGADCDDPQGDCDQDPACCLPNGSSCTINAQCCSNKCLGSLGSKHCQP
jgi:hypothetical protein